MVAEEAARRDPDPRKDPRTITLRAWNSARRALESVYGHIPQANEVLRQLSDRSGRPFGWSELLDLVFDEGRDVKKTHEERLSEPERSIDERDIEFGLLFVANRLGRNTLLPDEYAEARETLLARAKKERRDPEALGRRLPTHGQIENACGSWDRALEIAGLRPRSRPTPPRVSALSPSEAIALFFAKHGHLPTSTALDLFARDQDFAVRSAKGIEWETVLEEAVVRISELGLPAPPPYGAGPPPGWEPHEVEGITPSPRLTHRYRRVRVIEAIREFVGRLPAGTSPNDRRYRGHSRGRSDIPSLNVIKRHGGLASLVDEAARPDWHERALRWEADHPQRPPKPRAHQNRARTKQGVAKRIQLMRLLATDGPSAASRLGKALSVSRVRAFQIIQELEPVGYIERTVPNRRSSKQAYALTALGKAALASEDALRRTLLHPQRSIEVARKEPSEPHVE